MPKKTSQKNKKPQARLVLLDMHAILHRAYHALPDFATSAGEPSGALYGLSAMILKIMKDLDPDYIVAAYDLPQPTLRHEAFKDYKAGRAKTDDALIDQIERSRGVLEGFDIPAYQCPGFEADDVLGTIVEEMKQNPEIEVVIASGDMDTLQLVDKKRVKVYTLRKGMNDTVLYGYNEVIERFGFAPELLPDFKGLRGDPSDNIPGIRGIGEKTATTLITTFGTIEEMYAKLEKNEKAFEDVKITPRIRTLLKEGKEEAEFSKLLATIRTDADVSFTLPEKPWKESVSLDSVLELFTKLDFRTLSARARASLGEKVAATPASATLFSAEAGGDISDEHLEEAKIALWLLNSDLTNPSKDDILAYTKKQSLEDARTGLLEEIKREDLTDVFEGIEKPIIPVLKKMNENGVKLDVGYLDELSKTHHKELTVLEKRIFKHAGEEFNINSPKQLGDILFEKMGLKGGKKTATGQRSTRESELEKLEDAHPIIKDIIAYRELQKLLSTYIDAFPKMVAKDGRLHTTFVQTGTTTGRMSSQAPNLQNIPIRTELGRRVRGAFIAERGCSLITLDYSQIELRIAAILSGDEKMVKTFAEGGDIHTTVASEIFDVPLGEVTPDMRRTAKVINFGILYGMGSNALAKTAGMSRSDAVKYLTDYENTFVGLSKYMSEVKGEARTKGYTSTLFGRRRHLPGMRSSLPHLRAEAERQAVNAPLQGTSADIIKCAMARANEEVVAKYPVGTVKLVMQIHDELVYEVKDELVEEVAPKIRLIMESVVPKEKLRGVPIIVDAAAGKRWSDMKKL